MPNHHFNAILIIPLNMEIQGAALATIISQFICFAYYCVHFISGSSFLKINSRNMIFQGRLIGEILSIGVASFAMMSAVSISAIVINRVLVSYGGDIAVSAYGVLNRIMMVMIIPGLAFGQGLQPILGFNYGALRYDRSLKAIKLAMLFSTACSIVIFFLMFFTPEPFIRMFTNEPELINISSYAAKRVYFVSYVLGIIFVGPTIFQSIGKPVQSFITSIVRPVLFLIATVLILPYFGGIDGLWIAFAVTDFLAVILNLSFLVPQVRELRRRHIAMKLKKVEAYTD